jgi:uncharacterized protein YegJ (DUF2314 family)
MRFLKIFSKKKNSVRKRKGNPDVYGIASEDERMNWGMDKARLTLHYFEDCLVKPKKGQQYFSIKVRIVDNEKTEHIWLNDPNFDNQGNIFGTVGNEPIDVSNISVDENVGVSREDVSDWMIIENGRLIGGYTIRAMRESLKGKELRNFDKSLGGVFIDEGEDYFVPNFETPEGAILLLEEAYDNEDIENAINCNDFHKQAELMLEKTLKTEIDNKLINKAAEVLKLEFIKNLQESGMPKFKGVKRAFKRNFVSDEHCIISEICFYPDGSKSSQLLNTYKIDNQWKVGSPEN